MTTISDFYFNINIKREYVHYSDIVSINYAAIQGLVVPPIEGYSIPIPYIPSFTYLAGKRQSIEFLIAKNSINFCFWDLLPDKTLKRFKYKDIIGALGMTRAFSDAWGGSLDNFRSVVANSRLDWLPDVSMPVERLEILDSILRPGLLEGAAECILDNYKKSEIFNIADVINLQNAFPLVAFYDKYYKKAHLTMIEIAGLLSVPTHHCIFSVPADYQLPKVLRGMGILEYSPELANIVDNMDLIEADSKYENAIRSATMVACKYISEDKDISIPQLDTWLWEQRNNYPQPFHLTYTTNY